MRISVIIPAYNEEQYIASCLKTVLDQDTPADEIIVVDNNSTDRTRAIASRFPVHVLSERQQGMIHARNAGFDAATGDVIVHCDADTRVPRDWITRIRRHFEEDRCDALTGPAVPFHAPPSIALPIRHSCALLKRLYLGHLPLQGCNKSLRRELWHRIRNEVCTDADAVHEDLDLAIHIYRNGGRIVYDSRLMVYSSGRRAIERPLSFFFEYPLRFYRTVAAHKPAVYAEEPVEQPMIWEAKNRWWAS